MALHQTIASLEESTRSLCSRVGDHLEVDEASQNDELVFLLAELQSVCGVLQLLRQLVADLDHQHEILSDEPCPRVFDLYRSLIRNLELHFGSLSSGAVQNTTAAITGFHSKFSLALATSVTTKDFVQHLSLLSETAFADQIIAIKAAATQSAAITGSNRERDGSNLDRTPTEVSSWLGMLNSSAFNREPESYVQEKLILRSLRLRIPQYSLVAVQWPEYAERYWSDLQTPICTLFQTPSSFNFIQWALEYARETLPETLGSHAISADGILDLTEALCDGSASPLHVAAALGLPSLCDVLFSKTPSLRRPRGFGTPLSCALMGTRALSARTAPSHHEFFIAASFDDREASHSHGAAGSRAATIGRLLDAGSDCKYKYRWSSSEQTSLAGLAFRAAFHAKDETIFQRVISGGAALDGSFRDLVRHLRVFGISGPMVPRLLTLALDCSLESLNYSSNWNWPPCRRAIEKWMDDHLQPFVFGREGTQYPGSDDAFFELVTMGVSDGETFIVRRLSHDPRFDPEMVFDGGTLLHVAVQANQLDMVDLLVELGSDLAAIDDECRTTLMLVESTDMMSKLVLEHGVSTSAVDDIGRNVWHCMASSNDLDCLKWLCDNDPCKKENLLARAINGNTPLAEAFHFLNDLADEGRTPMSANPSTARILLQECVDPACLWSTTPLTHLAAAWGQLDLVESLVALGADFQALDESGRSALHHLNLTATPALIARLQELCAGLPIEDKNGLTPAETTILNTTVIFKSSSDPIPPNVWRFADRAFPRLLTHDVLTHRDYRDRGCWARFCETVFQPSVLQWADDGLAHAFWMHILNALTNIVSQGALKNYEEETSQSAACVFEASSTMHSNAHIAFTLEQSSKSLARSFYKSQRAIKLLRHEARTSTSLGFIRFLSVNGVPRVLPPGASNMDLESDSDVSPLESAILSDHMSYEKVEILLQGVGPADLAKRQIRIFLSLFLSENESRLKTLALLLEKGLDPNPSTIVDEPENSGQSPLALAIANLEPMMVPIMLDKGANPIVGRGGFNAVMAAVWVGDAISLDEMLPHIGPDFDWLFCTWSPEHESRSYNALQLAATQGKHHLLGPLLTKTPLRNHINDVKPRNPPPPAHLAAAKGHFECLSILVELGADTAAIDIRGSTPLHLAAQGNHWSCVEFLLKSGPRDVRDNSGSTPFDYAQQLEEPGLISIFQKYDVSH